MSVKAYVDSLVQDCATEIIEILEQGPLSEGQLRRALRMEHHVAMIVIDRALRLLVTEVRFARASLYRTECLRSRTGSWKRNPASRLLRGALITSATWWEG